MNTSDPARVWTAAGHRAASLVNLGWVADRFLPLFGVANLMAAAAWILCQKLAPDLLVWYGGSYAAVVLSLLIVALWQARRRWYGEEDGLLHLDLHLGLHGALGAARAGAAPWPSVPAELPSKLVWKPTRPAGFAVLSLLLIALVMLVRLDAVEKSNLAHAPQKPASWKQMEDFLKEARETPVFEPEQLKKIEERLARLEAQKPEDWFTPASMEAGDNLRNQTAQSVAETLQNLSEAGSAAQAVEGAPAQMTPQDREQLEQQFDQALAQLGLGTLPLNNETLSQLKQMSGDQLSALSPDALKKLQEKLGQCRGLGKGMGKQLGLGPIGEGEFSDLPGEDGDGEPGSNGISRGRGDADLTFKREASPGGATPEGLSNPNLDEAALGEVVKVSRIENDQRKPDYGGVTTGGAAASQGSGGDAVWKNRLSPQERKSLQRYFK